MPKNLVLVESPTKARTIAHLLKGDYEIKPTMGHVIDLPENRLGVRVKQGFDPYYVVLPSKKKVLGEIEKLAKSSEGIFVATDPDREGEAIGYLIKEYLKDKGIPEERFRRVEFHEITPVAIRKAFANPREFDENLVEAQKARRILDRIVGYYISPLLWKKVSKGLSAGRVQSVALRLIVEREREIRSFQPKEYWEIHADFLCESQRLSALKLTKIEGKKAEIPDEASAQGIAEELKNLNWRIVSAERKVKKKNPPAPFTTSSLQQSAFNQLGFSASKTMQIAQQLYEGVDLGQDASIGLITYMRTDSVNIAETALEEVRAFISDKIGKEFLPEKPNRYKSRKGAQEAHEAIRPTSVYRTPESIKDYLTKDQFLLYQLIWKRFVASQMRPAEYDQLTVVVSDEASKYEFRRTFSRLAFRGFMEVYSEDRDEEQDVLPEVSEGALARIVEVTPSQHFTKPPSRYNDASLVRELEEKGIGRPSTYAPTIQTIIQRGYVVRKRSALVPTDLGEKIVELLVKFFPEVMDYEFTAKMEEKLDEIEEGSADKKSVLEEFYPEFVERVVYASKNMEKAVEESDYRCEKCGAVMLVRWGRTGKYLSCSNYPRCKNTKPLPTGVKCPRCGGDLVLRRATKGRRKGRTFYGCSNYPECNYVVQDLETARQEAGVKEG